MQIVGTTAGAALITEQTGRSCSPQNLGQLVRRGKLPVSTVNMKPVRLNADTLIQEYEAKIDARQSMSVNPGPGAPKEPRPPGMEQLAGARSIPGMIPDYNDSRARSEFEKANLLELDRKAKEALLIPRDQVEKVWADAVTIARTKLLAVPTRARQRIPHLTLEEVAILDDLQREALQELSDGN